MVLSKNLERAYDELKSTDRLPHLFRPKDACWRFFGMSWQDARDHLEL